MMNRNIKSDSEVTKIKSFVDMIAPSVIKFNVGAARISNKY
jgi:hypothetical protein